jgi:Uma2 family endonuclease
MVAYPTPIQRKLPRIPAKQISPALIYEIMDGKPIYYKGYRDVLTKEKTIEEIMGSSGLQSIIIEYILMVLYRSMDTNYYRILTNELGLHLNRRNNLSGDIAIYEKSVLPTKLIDKHYVKIAPKIQIEVDITASVEKFDSPEDYMYQKTQKLLDFGTEKVIWILSNSKKVLIATSNENWQTIDWNKDINVINGINFCIGKYLREEESPYA